MWVVKMNEIIAAIDCGTNSIRLLVAEVNPDNSLTELRRELRIVRLGEGVDQTGEFKVDAVERTIRAAAEYSNYIQEMGVTKFRFAATSATRDASNRHLFTFPIKEMFGIEPEVISGDMEASLSFRGATSSLTSMGKLKNTPYLVIDIGGGSTEFVLGVKHPTNSISVDIGCVRMSERHNLVEVFDPAQLAAARKDIQKAIEQAANQVEISTAGSIIGVAGTVTTVAAIALGLTEYDPTKLHGAVIKTSEVTRVAKMLREMTRTQKAAIPAMHPGRVDVIAAGALVLEMILDEVGLGEIIVSEHDILDGLALSLID